MKNVEKIVGKIIEDVRANGDKALLKYTRKLDGFSLNEGSLRIADEVVKDSVKKVSPQFLATLDKVKKNIERFQRRTLPKSWVSSRNGVTLGEKYTPLESVGIYIPGGKYPYPSTVLMTAIPAQVAGVKNIIMVTPPSNINNDVLAAACVCGVKEVFQVGGAQAIAALAFGTKTIPRVDKIVGPGNIYVAVAKKLVFGQVGIDSIAGPSEVIVVADDFAKSEFVIADLMAQAEHGSGASATLLTTSSRLYRRVKSKIAHHRNVKVKLIKDFDEIINEVNEEAPEHVELLVKDAKILGKKIKNAGAIFMGYYTPTATGDYVAGPSHVLPTDRAAHFSSGLDSADFVKRSSIIEYTSAALNKTAKDIITMAEREGFKYHAASVIQRVGKRRAGGED